MDVSLGSLDVIMEVVAEGLNVRYDLFPTLVGQMAREQDWSLGQ
jgi:hypothetical protein